MQEIQKLIKLLQNSLICTKLKGPYLLQTTIFVKTRANHDKKIV